MFHLSHRISPLFMRRLARLLVVPLIALALGLRPPVAAHAAGAIVVNYLRDNVKPDGSCTLREAIIAANTNAPVDTCAAGAPGADIITFSISGTIVLTSRLPDISEELIIRGAAADRLTISGNNAVTVLYVASNGILNLENVTVANGSGPRGGGIENHGTVNLTNTIFSGNHATENGGAIFNTSLLIVTNSTFSGNLASSGGAIFNTEVLIVVRSSFINNRVTNLSGGGGGIASNGYLYVVNSTFSGNLASSGGGVFSSDGTLSVVSTTLSGNSARAGGGIYFGGFTDEAILKDTIIADSAGGNCGGPIVPSGTYNLVTDASCGPSTIQTSSKELRLGPLQDNGGPTKTIAPQAGSVAIDAGDPVYCAAEPVSNRDQRGEVRPQGLGCDVGAVEVKPSYYPPVAHDDSYNTIANPAQPLGVDAAHGLLSNDYDQDGDTLQAVLSSEPSHGKLAVGADGSFSYIPSRDFVGSDSFSYRASDGSHESDVTTVTISVGIVAAADDSYSTALDTALIVDAPGVLANDVQADGKPLLAQLVKEPSHGKLSLNEDGSFSYIPEEGFAGSDSFDYRAADGSGESSTATVTIAVTP